MPSEAGTPRGGARWPVCQRRVLLVKLRRLFLLSLNSTVHAFLNAFLAHTRASLCPLCSDVLGAGGWLDWQILPARSQLLGPWDVSPETCSLVACEALESFGGEGASHLTSLWGGVSIACGVQPPRLAASLSLVTLETDSLPPTPLGAETNRVTGKVPRHLVKENVWKKTGFRLKPNILGSWVCMCVIFFPSESEKVRRIKSELQKRWDAKGKIIFKNCPKLALKTELCS